MSTIVVRSEKVIARPIEVVRSQFIDMAHHAAARVHAGVEVSNVRPQENGCRFTNRRRVFGITQEDEIEATKSSDGNSVLRSLSGANKGLLITQAFESLGSERTRVEITVELPVRGAFQLLAPLVRVGLKRDVASALEEDRVDLEERGYAAL